MSDFSWRRLLALLRKEWIQVRRDAMTLRIIIAIPIMQLFLFGFAINSDPKNLPTGLLSSEHSEYERDIVAAMKNSGYYNVVTLSSEADADEGLADATDPTAIGNATVALASLNTVLQRDPPPIRRSAPPTAAFQFVVHARYNPEQLTMLNIVPGPICIVLTFSTLHVTTLSITKERERGTMENLLAMPVRPLEVMIAKITPYLVIGYVQVALILIVSALFFQLPIRGSIPLLLGALGLFIGGNLALGVLFSTISANQMQATQLAQFTLMPSFLLSGFMFPFRGMPLWAQWAGEVFPTTHAMRIVRGMLLKGNGWTEIAPELWPIALFTLCAVGVAVWFYRETLD